METWEAPPVEATLHMMRRSRAAQHEDDALDEALDESFTASDPVALSITMIDVRWPAAADVAGN